MNLLVLGRGKTGALVAQVACEHGHNVRVLSSRDNWNAGALHKGALASSDVVVDFTTAHAVLPNIEACVRARKNIVVATTGWYCELPRVREMVEAGGIGFLYGRNFSATKCGFNSARWSMALKPGYARHRSALGAAPARLLQRAAAPREARTGTAFMVEKLLADNSGLRLQFASGAGAEMVGTQVIVLDSVNHRISLMPDPQSRRRFAEGAVHAAEWLEGKRGFFEFGDMFRD